MLNIQEIIQQVKNVAREKDFGARDDIKNILLKNCKFIAQEFDPWTGENKSIYLHKSNFIVFREETMHRQGKRVYSAFKVKIIGPYHEQLFYLNVLGSVVV